MVSGKTVYGIYLFGVFMKLIHNISQSMIFCGELMIMLQLWLKLRKLKVYLYCNFLIIAYNVIKILFEIAIVDL